MTDAICKKVSSMLSLYIDNKVNYQERSYIEDHLANCEECHKKYLYLKSLIKNLKDSYKQVVELAQKKQKQMTFSIREHEKFMDNLSPYVDNELSAQECFEFRKYLVKSKIAQKELKGTYQMQKQMRLAFDKAQKNMSFDSSKYVLNSLKKSSEQSSSKIQFLEDFRNYRRLHPKTMKVAILSGLVIFGAIEAGHLKHTWKGNEKEKAAIVKETKTAKINPFQKYFHNKFNR